MVFSRCVKTIGLKCLSPLLTREPVQWNQDMELGILQNQLFSNTAEGIAKQTHNFDFVFAFLKVYLIELIFGPKN